MPHQQPWLTVYDRPFHNSLRLLRALELLLREAVVVHTRPPTIALEDSHQVACFKFVNKTTIPCLMPINHRRIQARSATLTNRR